MVKVHSHEGLAGGLPGRVSGRHSPYPAAARFLPLIRPSCQDFAGIGETGTKQPANSVKTAGQGIKAGGRRASLDERQGILIVQNAR